MSKTKQAEEMFQANKDVAVKDVAAQCGITVAHAYAVRSRVLGKPKRAYRKRQTTSKKVVISLIKNEAKASNENDETIKSLNNSVILLEAQLSEALRRVDEYRVVIRYLERKIEDADAV
jgi:hypothetical protein